MDHSELGRISQEPDPQVDGAVSPDDDWTVAAIIAELDCDYDGELPADAIRAAQQRRDEIIPHLIKLIERATARTRDGDLPMSHGQLVALFLLTEFRAHEALPEILDTMSLPGDELYELYGDGSSEDLCRILAVLAENAPEQIDSLVANQSLDKYVRWAAAETYIYWVRDGRLSREQAVEKLRQHLRGAIANQDGDVAGALIYELEPYNPREALPEIEEAFRRDLVDDAVISQEEIEETLAQGDARWQHALRDCPPTGVEDTVDELEGWYCFQGPGLDEFDEAGFADDREGYDDDEDREDISQSMQSMMASHRRLLDGDSILLDDEFQEALDDNMIDDRPDTPPETIRRDGPRVGRNEPCPCGSGKKFKKCCGKH